MYIYIKDIYEGNQQLLVVVSKTLDYFCPKTYRGSGFQFDGCALFSFLGGDINHQLEKNLHQFCLGMM